MVKCPFCGFEDRLEGFRLLRDPWRFRFYTVRMLECPKCKGVFNQYEGASPKGRHTVFTIRVKPRSRRKGDPQ